MKKYHGHPRFHQLIKSMGEIHSRKSHDYAGTQDPFSNFRRCEELGVPAWKGALIRLTDKLSRIIHVTKQGKSEVKDEKITDTFIDLANYALICLILYEETKNKKSNQA